MTEEELREAFQAGRRNEKAKLKEELRKRKAKMEETSRKGALEDIDGADQLSIRSIPQQNKSLSASTGDATQYAEEKQTRPDSNTVSSQEWARDLVSFKIPKRPVTGSMPTASKKLCAKTSTTSSTITPSEVSTSWPLPSWYLKEQKTGKTKRTSEQRRLVDSLKELRRLTLMCEDKSPAVFQKMRKHLHSLAFQDGINEIVLKETKIFDQDAGLRHVLENNVFPSDIQDFAEELYNKWAEKNFSINLFRGIVLTTSSNRAADRLLKGYPCKAANAFRHNDLVNGQWWPTQLALLRDGGHGSSQGGKYLITLIFPFSTLRLPD